MKKLYYLSLLLSVFFLLANISSAQLIWQNPLPQGNHIYSVQFTDSQTGWATGYYGNILKTTNGGITFVSKIFSEIPEKFSLFYLLSS
jgi:hypothetical protein